ncbi:MAG: PAS domain S-box protein [Proteobacteria bacterium]|nr:PAS domain S-box protein [Pseudomonadota bacterium]MBU1688260.1 PAS domain S-box protein [Pseudomonadota bacterium]
MIFSRIRIALLLDAEGRVREIFNPESLTLPDQLFHLPTLTLARSLGQVYLTTLAGEPYLLAAAEDGASEGGYLLLVSPLDAYFLQSFSPVSPQGVVMALVSGVDQLVVASNVPGQIKGGTQLDNLRERFFIVGKEFFDYGSSDLDLSFISLISVDEVRRTTAEVLAEARQQRGIVSLGIIVVCLGIMLSVVGRIQKMAHRVVDSEKILLLGSDIEPLRVAGDEVDFLAASFTRLIDRLKEYQQRAEHDATTLRSERDLARQYLDIAGVMIVLLDAEGRVQMINRKGCQVLGCNEAEVVGCNWFADFIPEDHRAEVWSFFQKGMVGQESLPDGYENPVKTVDGSERLIVWNNVSLMDGSGRIVGTLSSGEDITEKRVMEQDREQLIMNLKKALSEVKTLSGMLPICAWCKKVRNDDGYWDQIEGYIQRHSDALFSHGICPSCMKKNYPDLDDENDGVKG